MYLKSKKSILSTLNPTLAWPFIAAFLLEMLQTKLLDSIAVMALLFWVILLCNKKLIDVVIKSTKAYSLIAFEIWGALSLIWSFLPMTSAYIIVNELAFFILGMLLAYYLVLNNKTIGDSLKLSALILTLLVLFYSVVFYGSSTSSGGFKSFYSHKNGLGFVMAVCFLIIFCTANKRFYEYFLMITTFIFLVLSQSKTPLNLVLFTVFILGIAKLIRYWFNNSAKFTQNLILLATKFIPYIIYLIVFLLVIFREDVASYLMQVITDDLFTGRGQLWNAVLSRSSDNLLMGIGPGVFWGAGRASEIAQTPLYIFEWIQNLRSADGGYIDLIGSLGFIGLAIILITHIQVYQLLFKVNNNKDAPVLFALITFNILHNITETDIYKFKDPLWFLYICIFFYLIFLDKNTQQPKLIKQNIKSILNEKTE